MCEECGCSKSIKVSSDHDPEHDQDSHEPLSGHKHAHIHRRIDLTASVMGRNDQFAAQNRNLFKDKGVYAVNLISSPGAGKTALVEAMAHRFGHKMVVVEGDIQTSRDAERVIRAGSKAYQIETGGACHLDAHSVGHAVERLDFHGVKLLVIENVGNLVCPSSYDLGEHDKIALLSLPEGDDKILKYPALFHRIGVLLINKIDLAPYMDFNVTKAVNECRSLNRSFQWFSISSKTGEGLDAFFAYLEGKAGF
jgi:hydrogenase nickel incorporation protein HypB